MSGAEIAYVAIAASVAATAASAYGSYESGRQQKKAMDYNARLAEQQAENARRAAAINEENYRKDAAQRLARIRAGYAKSGVTFEGTPLLVMMDSAREAELDALRIREDGEIRASGFIGEAGLQRMMGSQAAKAGMIGAGTNLLTGASTAGSMYYRTTLKKQGE